MNKKGISFLKIAWILLFILILGYAYWDYHLEKNGQNKDKAEFCKDLGYEVENEISFFYQIVCYKIEDGIKTEYGVEKSNEGGYYLKKLW